VILLVLVLLAASTRLLPLAISQFPFNNDGLTESAIADDILATGNLNYADGAYYVETHSVTTPVYNVLLAFESSVIGSTPMNMAQIFVAAISVGTVLCGFFIALRVSRDLRGSLLCALFLSLFGTFVFQTGSAWKESLGVSLYLLFVLAYMNRNQRPMMALWLVVMCILPFVHHLVTVIAYLTMFYLTLWSVFFAARNHALKSRHYLDVTVLGTLSLLAYVYYRLSSLDRLAYVDGEGGLFAMGLAVVLMSIVAVFLLATKTYIKRSLAPMVAVTLVGVAVWDYFDPVFSYTPGSPHTVLLLVLASGAIVCVAWYGLESMIKSNSRYRAMPVGLLLPTATLLVFAILMIGDVQSHQIVYRTFDFADPCLALGLAAGVAGLRRRPRLQWMAVATTICALLISFPFAYASADLLGVRHDTQAYEVDSLDWLHSATDSKLLSSEERIAYIAMSTGWFYKDAHLPQYIVANSTLLNKVYFIIEENWVSSGVNDYPRGTIFIPISNYTWMLSSCNVLYVGGPASDTLTLFKPTDYGRSIIY